MNKLLVLFLAVLLVQACLAKKDAKKDKKKKDSSSSSSSSSEEKKGSKKCPPSQILVIREVTVCELDLKKLICPQGSTIQVHEAFYGRKNAHTCLYNGATLESDYSGVCSTANALQIVKDRCTGLTVCDLEKSRSWFSDPCRGTNKYLEVSFSCTAQAATVAGKSKKNKN